MADYSPHVLARAGAQRQRLRDEGRGPRARLPQPAARPRRTQAEGAVRAQLQPLRQPPDRRADARRRAAYEPLVRASITPGEIKEMPRSTRSPPRRSSQRSRTSSATGRVPARHRHGVHFWSDVWDAVHLEEIYSEIPAPSSLRVAPSADAHLDELLRRLPDWTRVHRSTVAMESFAQTLQLLHHEGVLVAQDIFVREVSQYAVYRGPGKLEGSIAQLAQRPDLRARRRAPRLQRRRGEVRLPGGVEHGRPDRAPPRHAPHRAGNRDHDRGRRPCPGSRIATTGGRRFVTSCRRRTASSRRRSSSPAAG